MASTLVVIGTGLIGSSLAKAAKERAVYDKVWAVNRSDETNKKVIELGIAHQTATYNELGEVLGTLTAGDLVVVAIPVRAHKEVFGLIKPMLPEAVVLTDVGSTKTSIMDAATEVWGELPPFFVPAHPIAGSEQSGVTAVNPNLFQGRRCILTPGEGADLEAIASVQALWEAVGTETDQMAADHHDEILGATSHLPHVLAYAIVDALYTLEQKTEVFRYAAGGFRDFTRIAESDPVMWRDVFLANRDAILSQLDNFEAHLVQLRAAIDASDSTKIEAILERSQGARKLFSESKA